jgi:hemerythrin
MLQQFSLPLYYPENVEKSVSPEATEGLIVESLTWHEELHIGVESVDKQHKTILSDLENIYNLVSNHASPIIVKEILDELRAHSKSHFADEENLMLIYNYPAINNHVKQHELFIEIIDNCKESCTARETGALQKEVLDMLICLKKHILEYDKQYMEHFYI